jgi:hypothetical protein
MPKGTYVFTEPVVVSPEAALQAAPVVVHDAPTQPSVKRPAKAQILWAEARLLWASAQPIDRAAAFAVLAVYALCFCLLAGIVGLVTYSACARPELTPARQAILDPRSFAPLVHLAVEPLGMAAPTTQPRATPAGARRPPVIITIPTPKP